MKRLARWLLNAFTALSVLLCAATIAAWIFSYQHPWQTSVEFDKFAPNNGGYTFPDDPGTWHVFWNQRQHFYGGWDWRLSADSESLQVDLIKSYIQGDDYAWWQPILLGLLLPLWRSVPQQTADFPSRWEWLFRRPRIRVVTLLQDLYSIFLAHCLASYLSALLLATGWIGSEEAAQVCRDPWNLLAAPLIPLYLIEPMSESIYSNRQIVSAAYFIALLAIYIWRMDGLIHTKPNAPSALSSPSP